METWQLFDDSRFQLRFKYPMASPQGHIVEKTEHQRDDAVRVHLVSQESQELYFEVVKFANLSATKEYQQHRAALRERFPVLDITELQTTTLASLPAFTYSFQWPEKERAVILIEWHSSTYRIIYDPRSQLNEQIIATIEFID